MRGKTEYNELELFDNRGAYIGYCFLDKVKGFWMYDGKLTETKFVSETLNILNSQIFIPVGFYVYLVYVDKELKYIGKGVGSRYQHSLSGTSHVLGLNRAYFAGDTVEVMLYAQGLSEEHALNLESGLISLWCCKGLFNTRGNIVKSNNFPTETQQELFNRCKLLGVRVGFGDFYQDVYDHKPFKEYHGETNEED